MGPELALAATLGGTGLQLVGSEMQRNKRNSILRRSEREAGKTQDKAIATVTDEAKMLAPDARKQAFEDQAAANYAQTMADTGGATLVDTSQQAGAVSDDFARLKAQRTGEEAGRLSSVAQELSRLRAPGDVTTKEAARRSAIAEQLGSMWSSQNSRSRAAGMDADSVGNPLGDLGTLVSLAGMAGGIGTRTTLGEGVSSGIDAWDAALSRVPAAKVPGWGNWAQKLAMVSPTWGGR